MSTNLGAIIAGLKAGATRAVGAVVARASSLRSVGACRRSAHRIGIGIGIDGAKVDLEALGVYRELEAGVT